MKCYDTLHENHQLEKKLKSSAGKEAEIFLKICAYVSPTSDTAPGRGDEMGRLGTTLRQ